MSREPGAQRVPVLVLGAHITALGVLRLLAERGVESHVVDETSDIVVRSRWYRRPERTLRETPDSEVLAAYLESLSLPRAVLIPCSDRWMRAVSGLPAATRERFPASVPQRSVIEEFVNKERFAALVERLGIPHPRTAVVREPGDLDALSDEELADGFLKPTESQRYYLRFGTKGVFPGSREHARQMVEAAGTTGLGFLFQEWIPGPTARSILIDGFVDRRGTISTMLARRRLRMDPPRIANTASSVTVPLAEVADAADAVRTLLAGVAYRGIFNVEFKFDERDGCHRIIEVNARPYWHIAHAARSGVDLAWMAYRDALDEEVAPVTTYEIGHYGMYEVPEIAAILRAWGSRRRPEGPVLAPWLRGTHTLLWVRDPLPGVVDLWRAVAGRVRSLATGGRSMRT